MNGEHAAGSPAEPRWPAGSLLSRLPAAERAALLSLGTRVVVRAGRPILRASTAGDHTFLLLTGAVKVTGNEAGREPLLAVRLAGDLVGEMSMLNGVPRSATVVPCAPSVVKQIPGAELRALLAERPAIVLELAGILSDRLRWAEERRVDFAALPAAERVASILVALDTAYGRDTPTGRELSVALTQAEIASLAGVRLPTAEKALRALHRAGLIRLGYRRLTVLDPAALRAEIRG